MRTFSRLHLVGLLSLLASSCTHYSGVARADGLLYISGGTSYFVVTVPWVKRCTVEGTQLKCEELTEKK